MEEQRKKIEMEYEKEQAAAREKEEAVGPHSSFDAFLCTNSSLKLPQVWVFKTEMELSC